MPFNWWFSSNDPYVRLFRKARHALSCGKYEEAYALFKKVALLASDPILIFEAKRQIPVCMRLLNVSYETVLGAFLDNLEAMHRAGLRLSLALCQRDLARLHLLNGLPEAAEYCLSTSNEILDAHIEAKQDFDWPAPFAWRRVEAEKAINDGFEGLVDGSLILITQCEQVLRQAGAMYRDARLDNLIAGIEIARRTEERRIVAWWTVKACAVALLRLHPRWKRAVEALILAVLGPEIRNRIKSKYLRKK